MLEYMSNITKHAPASSDEPTSPNSEALNTGVTVPKSSPPKTNHFKSILSTIAVLLIAPILALTITAYIFQSYEVDGPSMQTTLQNHDRLIIWKMARTWSRITGHKYIPNRGDVVVFIKKGLYEDNSSREKQLIKRVIGLPGERVVVKDGKVTVFNAAHPDGFSPDATLPYGKVITTTEGNVDLTVPANEVFVSGDNRANSLDSRYFGPVPVSDVVGKLAARILPFNQAETF
jgi:signal peptidase I